MSDTPMFFDTATGKPVDLAAEMMAKLRETMSAQGQAVEAYIRAYLDATKADIRDLELVEQRHGVADGITYSWFLRPRDRSPVCGHPRGPSGRACQCENDE